MSYICAWHNWVLGIQDRTHACVELLVLPAGLYWLFVLINLDELLLFLLPLLSHSLLLKSLDVGFFDSFVGVKDFGTDV